MVLPEQWEMGYPDGPEMDRHRLRIKQFLQEWDSMEHTITSTVVLLEIGSKSPEELLKEVLHQMESKCC